MSKGINVFLNIGPSVVLSVRMSMGREMVVIDVGRGVEIFTWTNLPVSPNHAITATKATDYTAMTNRKMFSQEFLRSGIRNNSEDGTCSEIKISGSYGSSTTYSTSSILNPTLIIVATDIKHLLVDLFLKILCGAIPQNI